MSVEDMFWETVNSACQWMNWAKIMNTDSERENRDTENNLVIPLLWLDD